MTTGIIQNITGSKSSVGYGDIGTYIIQMKQLLNKALATSGSTMLTINNQYDLSMEKAVMEFQSKTGIPKSGMIDDDTYSSLVESANVSMGNLIVDTEEDTSADPITVTLNPRHDSFFSVSNTKDQRINKKDIVIVIGNGITKTIKEVFMRSSGVEVDTSGNPITETYEFIAKDVVESDEPMDLLKYAVEEPKAPAADIKYAFNFGKTESSPGKS